MGFYMYFQNKNIYILIFGLKNKTLSVKNIFLTVAQYIVEPQHCGSNNVLEIKMLCIHIQSFATYFRSFKIKF